jgi:hypothetical protein
MIIIMIMIMIIIMIIMIMIIIIIILMTLRILLGRRRFIISYNSKTSRLYSQWSFLQCLCSGKYNNMELINSILGKVGENRWEKCIN